MKQCLRQNLLYKFSKELVAIHTLPGRTYELFEITLSLTCLKSS